MNIIEPSNLLLAIFVMGGIIGVLFVALLIILVIGINSYNENKQALLELQRYEINVSTFPFGESMSNALENFIAECFDDYRVKYLVPSQDGNPEYVTDEKEAEIRRELVNLVTERLSPTFLERLALYYRAEHIGSIIADKIYLIVMNYAIDSRRIREASDIQKIKDMPNEIIS